MKTKHIIIFLFLVLFGFSCTSFLDESNKSDFTQENYFKTAEHANSIVNAIYQDLKMTSSGDYGGSPHFMTDFLTGIANTRNSQNVNINNIRLVVNNSDNEYSKSWWNYSYRGIANANLALKRIPAIEMDESLKSRLLGEASCLRAYYYFNLVRLFGNIPLVLNPVDASSPELYPEQASIEDVYKQIVADLLESEKSSLTWDDQSGRVTMGVVKALLGSVYLTMAGYPLEKGQDYYSLAAIKLKEVIDNGSYYLFDSYDDLHDPEIKNKGEHMFMIQFQSGTSVENNLQYLYLPYNLDISYYSTETGTIVLLDEYIDSYESGDKRIEEKQLYFTNYTSNSNRQKVVQFDGYYLYKFFDEDAHLNTAKSGLNHPLIRYADILLQYAEAQNEADGTPSDASYKYVNQVRKRAELPELEVLSKDEFRRAVWKEKWHEFAFENIIWFDMVRTRKVFDLTTGDFNNYIDHQFTYGPKLGERELLFPIPTSEINNNKKLKQNLGY